jgi:hypothetical protein
MIAKVSPACARRKNAAAMMSAMRSIMILPAATALLSGSNGERPRAISSAFRNSFSSSSVGNS